MFWALVNISYAHHYKPRLIYLLAHFQRPFFLFLRRFFQKILSLCMACIQEWLVIKSGLWWRAYGRWITYLYFAQNRSISRLSSIPVTFCSHCLTSLCKTFFRADIWLEFACFKSFVDCLNLYKSLFLKFIYSEKVPKIKKNDRLEFLLQFDNLVEPSVFIYMIGNLKISKS